MRFDQDGDLVVYKLDTLLKIHFENYWTIWLGGKMNPRASIQLLADLMSFDLLLIMQVYYRQWFGDFLKYSGKKKKNAISGFKQLTG